MEWLINIKYGKNGVSQPTGRGGLIGLSPTRYGQHFRSGSNNCIKGESKRRGGRPVSIGATCVRDFLGDEVDGNVLEIKNQRLMKCGELKLGHHRPTTAR